jgi:hypothetical protein
VKSERNLGNREIRVRRADTGQDLFLPESRKQQELVVREKESEFLLQQFNCCKKGTGHTTHTDPMDVYIAKRK